MSESFKDGETRQSLDCRIRDQRDRLSYLEAENARLKEDILRRENEEASVCPEDVGVVEYVRSLHSQLAASTAEIARLREDKERLEIVRQHLANAPELNPAKPEVKALGGERW